MDEYCLNILKTLFSEEELDEMCIKKNYVLKKPEVFMDYVNSISPNPNNLKFKEQIILFMMQPAYKNFETLIYADTVAKGTVDIGVIFFPKETPEIIEQFIRFNLLDKFQIYNFNIDIVPIDSDLFSLESDESFREIYIDKNYDSVSQLANIVLKFEAAFGKIQNKFIKGDTSKIFNDFLSLKEEEHKIKSNEEILGMIVLDRSIDYITPLLSNYTFEGMIDEYMGINKGNITVKRSFVKSIFKPEHKKKKADEYIDYPLTSDYNSFYCNLRCMHFRTAFNYIKGLNNYYQSIINESKHTKKVDEMAEVFSEIKDFVFIENYINDNFKIIDLLLKETIEVDEANIRSQKLALLNEDPQNVETFYNDYISEKKDLYKILNLILLDSLTQNGIKEYSSLKRDIMNIYGYQNIFLFRNLEELGLIKERGTKITKKIFKSNLQKINENLNLINVEFNIEKIFDLSYIDDGYCPLTLKLIEKAVEGGWKRIRDTLELIPGETSIPYNEEEVTNPTENLNTIFVVFLGGITYAEIEGIRYLNRKYKELYEKENKPRKQFIIITTQILNYKKLYDNLGKKFKNDCTIKNFYNEISKK